MPNRSFTIQIFVPDGDPEGVRVIGRMGWTGQGTVFPREKWQATRSRDELGRPGVYILDGMTEDGDELPTVYVGEGDCVRDRIDAHFQNKDFWDRGIVFTASGSGLNKAHIRWLESALVKRARKASRSKLDNGNDPQPATLSEADVADTQAFLEEILQILPLVGLRAFEIPRPIAGAALASPTVTNGSPMPLGSEMGQLDTVIVPAWPDGFRKTFLGESRWHEIRISGGMLQKIKYIAAYVTQPESQITHYARVGKIIPYGEGKKYELIFTEPAEPLKRPIPRGDAPQGFIQGPRYTTFEKLLKADKLTNLF